jgi:hypothetical protein
MAANLKYKHKSVIDTAVALHDAKLAKLSFRELTELEFHDILWVRSGGHIPTPASEVKIFTKEEIAKYQQEQGNNE